MTDVLIDGRVIPVPPGWIVRVTLERTADDLHPVTRRGGDAAYSRRDAIKEPHDGGARPPGHEDDPTIDEIDPLPLMRKQHPNGAFAPTRGAVVPATTTIQHPRPHGKVCDGCGRRCGPRSQNCPACGHAFPFKPTR